jgi:hypothetical protein
VLRTHWLTISMPVRRKVFRDLKRKRLSARRAIRKWNITGNKRKRLSDK